MASICDGAVCLGLSTSLNGSECLTNEVQCKNGKLTVPSQGTRQRRYSAGGFGDFDTGPFNVPQGTTVIRTGPNNPDGSPMLSVEITNPFCTTASLTAMCEFGWQFDANISDAYRLFGNVAITSGAATFLDSAPPFATVTPSTVYNILLHEQRGLGLAGPAQMTQRHDSYTVLGTVPANDTFTIQVQSATEIAALSNAAVIRALTVALLVLLSPAL